MHYQLLEIIARSHPWLWEKIHPHVPITGYGDPVYTTRFSELNPQPLPPHEAYLAGSASLAHEIARTVVHMEARGEASYGYLSEIVDDWCGTPWPHKWPIPWTGPWPGPDPDPEPWWRTVDVAAGRVIAATVFASYASRIADDKFAGVFAEAAERLAEAALNGGGLNGARSEKAPTRAARAAGKRSARR